MKRGSSNRSSESSARHRARQNLLLKADTFRYPSAVGNILTGQAKGLELPVGSGMRPLSRYSVIVVC